MTLHIMVKLRQKDILKVSLGALIQMEPCTKESSLTKRRKALVGAFMQEVKVISDIGAIT